MWPENVKINASKYKELMICDKSKLLIRCHIAYLAAVAHVAHTGLGLWKNVPEYFRTTRDTLSNEMHALRLFFTECRGVRIHKSRKGVRYISEADFITEFYAFCKKQTITVPTWNFSYYNDFFQRNKIIRDEETRRIYPIKNNAQDYSSETFLINIYRVDDWSAKPDNFTTFIEDDMLFMRKYNRRTNRGVVSMNSASNFAIQANTSVDVNPMYTAFNIDDDNCYIDGRRVLELFEQWCDFNDYDTPPFDLSLYRQAINAYKIDIVENVGFGASENVGGGVLGKKRKLISSVVDGLNAKWFNIFEVDPQQ